VKGRLVVFTARAGVPGREVHDITEFPVFRERPEKEMIMVIRKAAKLMEKQILLNTWPSDIHSFEVEFIQEKGK